VESLLARGQTIPGEKALVHSEVVKVRVSAASDFVYQLRVTVWRRVHIDGLTTLPRLHTAIQKAMGRQNAHLHEFVTMRSSRTGAAASSWTRGCSFR
jgi:hypothetical protein